MARGVAAQHVALRVIGGQLHGGVDELLVVVHCGAVLAIAQVLARGAVVEGHRGHAAGHAFQGHVAEGLAAAGEQEQIAAGEMAGKRIAALDAAEDEVGFSCASFSRAGPSPTHTKRAFGRICCNRRKAFTARPRFFSAAMRPT
jgi:hypothetical protein